MILVIIGKFLYNEALIKQANLEAQKSNLEADGIEVVKSEYEATIASVAEAAKLDDFTFNYNEYWNDIIKLLESESVSNLVVGSVSSTESTLIMNVTVDSKEEAAKLLLQYQKIPYFSNIQISGIAENTDEETGITTVSFTLSIEYNLEYRPDREGAAD